MEERRRSGGVAEGGFEAFEREVRKRFSEAEREFIGEELERLDVTLPEVVIDGIRHRRVVSGRGDYMTAAGPVSVLRHRYRAVGTNGESECPLEWRAGIVEGYFTPLAARLGVWAVTHLTPAESESLFRELGGMSPSRSSLDRLPKGLSEKWEARRKDWENALRAQEEAVAGAAVLAVSLDGVMAPMKDGQRESRREQSRLEGKQTRGPAGHREVGCGSVSHYDKTGERLRTVRHARMPESKKQTLKRQLVAEVENAFRQQPQLRLVKVADGARDNWEFLAKDLPPGEEVVDFYHAAEHLKRAFEHAYGEASVKARASFAEYRHVLLEVDDGVEKVIRTLAYHHKRKPRCGPLKQELTYFRRNRSRMDYARLRAQNLPIGSGVVEATCKTLVTQRMKRSGQRWTTDGGQAILTFRALAQSDRFDAAWQMVSAVYRRDVSFPRNVVPINAYRVASV
ncbi:MAG: hypothetical protein KGZ68_16125 [Dechloromonas sp.]|nr:hypothetical protein [Dechloromonas sp.]